MLIPFLHENPMLAALLVPDNWSHKMIQEAYVILKAASGKTKGYKNNRFVIWVRESEWAWCWLYVFAATLAKVEYPSRYPDNFKKKGYPKHWLNILKDIKKPKSSCFLYKNQSETPLCPLPEIVTQKSIAKTHIDRVDDFRMYMRDYKNSSKPQLSYTHGRRPIEYMGLK